MIAVHRGFGAIADSHGRRGVHIYGAPREELGMAMALLLILGLPLAAFFTMMPFWDQIGSLQWIRYLNSYVAPGVEGLSFDYRSNSLPNFHLKRFVIGSTSIIELLLISNVVSLAIRGVRKHALLVWICYDRVKLLQYLGISGVIFCACWYFFFYDFRLIAFVGQQRRGGKLVSYAVLLMPMVTLLFGHMAVIVGLGSWRTTSKWTKRTLRRYFRP